MTDGVIDPDHPIDIDHLRQWIGRSQQREEVVAPTPVEGLAALLDYPAPPWPAGRLPPLGRWLAFLPSAPQSHLGEDGHARLGGFLPPIPLPRRMWAGSRVEFLQPLRLMRPLRQTTTIADVVLKSGGSGAFVRLTLRFEVYEGEDLAVREHQDLIYRPAAGPARGPSAAPASPPPALVSDYQRLISPDPTLLFRFSALTYNAHRIHYDRDFARDVEGYPGLVVHGPLQAMLLIDLYQRQHPDALIAHFACRAQRPLFEGAPFALKGRKTDDGAALWTEDADGRVCMEASVATKA
jgi:3-methylfumaryl-CoA hydratase